MRNARDLEDRRRRFDSVLAYLRSFGADGDALVRDIGTWAYYVGAPSICWFMRAVRGTREGQGEPAR